MQGFAPNGVRIPAAAPLTRNNLVELSKLSKRVPDEVALNTAVCGSADDCRDQILGLSEPVAGI